MTDVTVPGDNPSQRKYYRCEDTDCIAFATAVPGDTMPTCTNPSCRRHGQALKEISESEYRSA